jgi:hypothetical protein
VTREVDHTTPATTHLELLLRQSEHDVGTALLNPRPGQTVLDGPQGGLVESNIVLGHPRRLVNRAHPVIGTQTVLLQEVVLQSRHPRVVKHQRLALAPTQIRPLSTHLDHGSDLEGDLVGLAQSALSDQLHNLGQVIVLLQDLTHG